MFAPGIVEIARPTSIAKQIATYQHDAPSKEEEMVHFDTHMADLEMHEEDKPPKKIIKGKETKIREIKDRLSKANFMIAFLRHENRVKKKFLSKPKPDLEEKDEKGKSMIDVYQLEDKEVKTKPRRLLSLVYSHFSFI